MKKEEQQLRSDEAYTCIKEIEGRRRPIWPPLLRLITGCKEDELIPLALQYHRRVIQLFAEVARGSRPQGERPENVTELASELEELDFQPGETADEQTTPADLMSTLSSSLLSRPSQEECGSSIDGVASASDRCIRRHVIDKYCRKYVLKTPV